MGAYDFLTKPLVPQEVQRPEEWDISTITSGWSNKSRTIPPVKEENMSEFLQLIMDLETDGGENIYQKKGLAKNKGAGLFQLETGPQEGGMTRLTRAYTKLPKHLTPKALADDYRNAIEADSSYDVIKAELRPHQQKFLMAANIMLPEGGRRKYDEWVASGKSKEKFIDWWLDEHWKGWKSDKKYSTKEAKMQAREDKKEWAKRKLGIDMTDIILELENKENFLSD